MSKLIRAIEVLLLILLVVSTAAFLTFMNLYGVFLALVTAAITFGVYRRNRWGYFACAAWGLACYQLAKQGYEFADVKRYVMILGIFVVVVAIFLHEMLAKKSKQPQ
jgi:cytochrome b561